MREVKIAALESKGNPMLFREKAAILRKIMGMTT